MTLDRRAMLRGCLGIFGLNRARAWSLAISSLTHAKAGYRGLTQPVVLPLEKATASWHPVRFDALAPSLDPDPDLGPDVLLKGILLRLPQMSGGTTLKAFCLTCPHEICEVDYVADTDHVRVETGPKPEHPLLVCPCHFSVFNPLADGAPIVGPSPRGLYRFRLAVERDEIQIKEVEEEALV